MIINGNNVSGRNDRSLAKDLLKLVGIGLASGLALIAATDKVMTKATGKTGKDEPDESEEEE